uniref:Uncharacterized protein n=1 Tax=Rhodosorus marinus TaxID=101924 RepID=A0A7S0BL67_9RHOD|mmetsp:Transcript_20162/g.29267  ORF Transcript_20162/g.29267 Transcript_20162/m.29267 type:complete len:110 (+) Transcript_20162:61-390(+)
MAVAAFLTGATISGAMVFSLRQAVYRAAGETERQLLEIDGSSSEAIVEKRDALQNFFRTRLAVHWNRGIDSLFIGIIDAPENLNKLVSGLQTRFETWRKQPDDSDSRAD